MIVQAILDILFGVVTIVLGLLNPVNIAFDSASLATFFDIIASINYLFPLATVVKILGIVIALQVFRVIVAFVKFLWDIIPFA